MQSLAELALKMHASVDLTNEHEVKKFMGFVPVGENASSWAHSSATPIRPASLPPMPTVTSWSVADKALNCGGLVPNGTDWGWVISSVVALPQLTSVNGLGLITRATSDG